MKKFTIIFAAVGITFLSTAARADSLHQTYNSGRIDFALSLGYFKTTANFSKDGSKTSLPGSNQFQNINTLLGLRYVLIDDLGLFTEMGIGNAESKDNLSTRTNSAVSFVALGADYRILHFDYWTFVGRISYAQAVEKISASADSALINDGANEFKAFLEGSYDWGFLVPFAKVGINYRAQGLSTLFLYTFGTELRFDSIYLGAALNGLMSIKDDEKTNQPLLRESITNQVNAGSKRYYNINPNLIDSEIYLKYKMNQDWAFKAMAGYAMLGSNSAEGYHFGLAIDWGFGGQPRKYSPLKPSTKRSASKKSMTVDPADQTFKEDTNDGVNQDYFKPVSPSKNDYIEQLEGSSENLQNATQPEPETIPAKLKTKPMKNPALEKEYKIKIKKKKKSD